MAWPGWMARYLLRLRPHAYSTWASRHFPRMNASVVSASISPRRHTNDSGIIPAAPVRVLFINDTSRNGGPGRSLHSILRFLDPAGVSRAVGLPRMGAMAEPRALDAVAAELLFEPDLVENPIEPWHRAMER